MEKLPFFAVTLMYCILSSFFKKKGNVHIEIVIFQVNICCVLSESEYLISEGEQHSTPNLSNTDCIVREKI